jgi:hypothetical protein
VALSLKVTRGFTISCGLIKKLKIAEEMFEEAELEK